MAQIDRSNAIVGRLRLKDWYLKKADQLGTFFGYPKKTEVLGVRRTLKKYVLDLAILVLAYFPAHLALIFTSDDLRGAYLARLPFALLVGAIVLVLEIAMIYFYWNPRAKKLGSVHSLL